MRFCASCGHELGVGRFCTNCGQPVDHSVPRTSPPIVPPVAPPVAEPVAEPAAEEASSTAARAPRGPSTSGPDTEERRAVRREAALAPGPPRTPPAADVPPPPRFPLWADSPDADAPETQASTRFALAPTDGGSLLDRFGGPDSSTDVHADEPRRHAGGEDDAHLDGPHEDHAHAGEPGRRWGRWLLALLLVAALVAAGVLLWPRITDTGSAQDPAGAPTEATQLAAGATATVPGRAKASRELDGAEVTYGAGNLLDGDPTTTWRVRGNARGKEIVLTFPSRVEVSEVGLVNGYAKQSIDADGRTFDWYHGHRTVSRVVWSFDDGTEVSQDLRRERSLQTIAIDDLTTRTITLTLAEVSAPGNGRAGRDFTAVSEIEVLGTSG